MELHSEKIKGILENVLKIIGLFSGLSYVIGLLITSIYYSKYNFATFDLLSPQYVYAGLGFIISLLIINFILFTVIDNHNSKKNLLDRKSERKLKNWGKYIVSHIMHLSLWFVLFTETIFYISISFPHRIKIDNKGIHGILLYIAIASAMSIIVYKLLKPLISSNVKSSLLIVKPVIGSAIFSLMILALYSITLFPILPSSLGGAMNPQIYILFKSKDDLKEWGRAVGFQDTTKCITNPIKLIRETNDVYIVVSNKDPNMVLEIPKSVTNGSAHSFQ